MATVTIDPAGLKRISRRRCVLTPWLVAAPLVLFIGFMLRVGWDFGFGAVQLLLVLLVLLSLPDLLFQVVLALLFWRPGRIRVDEVFDGGAFLVLRKHGAEERLPLSNIGQVRCARWADTAQVLLEVDAPSAFGQKIVFEAPRTTWIPFVPNAIAEDLKGRVDRVRRQGALR